MGPYIFFSMYPINCNDVSGAISHVNVELVSDVSEINSIARKPFYRFVVIRYWRFSQKVVRKSRFSAILTYMKV
jgi:hypothetical protein